MKQRKLNSKGFTMIEIMAVVVILGILAGVAIPSVFKYVRKTRTQSYEIMQSSLYDGARNFTLDENNYLPLCTSGYADIENFDNMLVDLKYVERLTDPVDNSKQCTYNVYGCMESEPSMDSLASYKYKVQLKCTDYKNCAIYREDGTILPCEDTIDDTKGPDCGEYASSNPDWSAAPSVDIALNCVSNSSGDCAQSVYNQTFTNEGKSTSIEINDIFGNKTICPINILIDRTAPSKPIITNPYENKWTNKSYSIKLSSVDSVSGIKYFEYRYPNSSIDSEKEWKQWENSSKKPNDSTPFTTTNFTQERSELVEIRACDYAGNCSESLTSMIKIDKTKPTCSITITGTGGTNNIYTSIVSLELNVDNPGISSKSEIVFGLSNKNTAIYNKITTGTQGATSGITWYGSVKDEAGNTNTCNTGKFQVSLKPPVITFTLSGDTSTATCKDGNTDEAITIASGATKTLASTDLTHTVTCTNALGQSTTDSHTYKVTSKYVCTSSGESCDTCHGRDCHMLCKPCQPGDCGMHDCREVCTTTSYDCNCHSVCNKGYTEYTYSY